MDDDRSAGRRTHIAAIGAAALLASAALHGARESAAEDAAAPTDARPAAAAAWKSSTPERVTEGSNPWLSPSGTRLAFEREGLDLANRDERGQPRRRGILHVRDLSDGSERPTPRNGQMTGWAGDDLVVFHDGSSVRVAGAGDEPKFPAAPEKLYTPAWARSRDGHRVAYTVEGHTIEDLTGSPKGREHTIHLAHLVDGAAASKPLDLREKLDPRSSGGLLSFSPDGRRIAFHVGFMHYGQVPHPRVGVFDLGADAATLILSEPADSRGWNDTSTERGVAALGAWDGKSERFVFVRAAGRVKRDLFVSTADGADVRRLTTDGAWKSEPCLSPEGDRCAYWVASAAGSDQGRDRSPKPATLRVVFLRTGVSVEVPTVGEGRGSDLQWSPDGHSLWFGWCDEKGCGVDRVAAPPPPSVAPGTAVVDRSLSDVDEIVDGLRSDDRDEVSAKIRASYAVDDPAVTKALLDVLHRWASRRGGERIYDVVHALHARGAVAAIPDALVVLSSGEWVDGVTPLLVHWRVEAAIPIWRRLVASGPPSTRGVSALALARMGEPGAWDEVLRLAKTTGDEGKETRWRLVSALRGVRDTRAIEALLALVADHSGVYWDNPNRQHEVADDAAHALERLTGQSFGTDAAAWAAWWEKVGKKLPDAPDPDGAGSGAGDKDKEDGK